MSTMRSFSLHIKLTRVCLSPDVQLAHGSSNSASRPCKNIPTPTPTRSHSPSLTPRLPSYCTSVVITLASGKTPHIYTDPDILTVNRCLICVGVNVCYRALQSRCLPATSPGTSRSSRSSQYFRINLPKYVERSYIYTQCLLLLPTYLNAAMAHDTDRCK
jgi:hypothetical protein